MSDKISATSPPSQNTGNPVLDSLVNIIASRPYITTVEHMRDVYKFLEEVAAKEPGGLRRTAGTISSGPKASADEKARRAEAPTPR